MLVQLMILLVKLLIMFLIKEKITGQTDNNGTKDVETIVPLKYLGNFWRTLEMPLIKCKIGIFLTWSLYIVFYRHVLLQIKQQYLQ